MKKITKIFLAFLLALTTVFAACACSILELLPDETVVLESAETVDAQQEDERPDEIPDAAEYCFRNEKLLNQHYEKHGIEMGFASAEAYEKSASDVINNPNALHKTEAEDGDFVYYIESTNEFVVLSKDGYIRTYFLPDSGIRYYEKQ